MKLTESMLRNIIKEELVKVLNEGDVVSMKDYPKEEKYHSDVFMRLYGDNKELKNLAQSGKQKAFAIKLGELVVADDPEAKVKFYSDESWGLKRFYMNPQARDFYFRMQKGESSPVPSADDPNVLRFKSKAK